MLLNIELYKIGELSIDPLITFLASVDQKKDHFVFWSMPHHLVVTNTLNTHISETGGSISKVFFLTLLQRITSENGENLRVWVTNLQNISRIIYNGMTKGVVGRECVGTECPHFFHVLL